jgi:hypothetical protein
MSDTFGMIMISGDCKNFRIDNCKFYDIENRGIFIRGYSFGVIDHCKFEGPDEEFSCVCVYDENSDSWERPLSLGTENAVYIEDCTFNFGLQADNSSVAIDANYGGRFVFRNNHLTNIATGNHGVCANDGEGCFSFEFYNNTIISNTPSLWRAIGVRGGTGVIFNNTISGDWDRIIDITNYRSYQNCGNGWGACNGSNPIDGNEESNGYPCFHQIGRSTGPNGEQNILEPLYEWGNTFNNRDANITVDGGQGSQTLNAHLKEGRDFYNNTERPGYTPYEYPHPLTQILVPKNLRFVKK